MEDLFVQGNGGLRSKVLDISLRLPPLFLMDQLLLLDLRTNLLFFLNNDFLSSSPIEEINSNGIRFISKNATFEDGDDGDISEWSHIAPFFINFILHSYVYVIAFVAVSLSTKQLLRFYSYLISIVSIPLSSYCHSYMIRHADNVTVAVYNLAVQWIFAVIVATAVTAHWERNFIKECIAKTLPVIMSAPCALCIIGISEEIVKLVSWISPLIPGAILTVTYFMGLGKVCRLLINTYHVKRQLIADFGINPFLESEWERLRVPTLLRTFWLLRLGQQFLSAIYAAQFTSDSLYFDSFLDIGKTLLMRGCETIWAVLGMASVVSSICHYIGAIFHFILTTDADDEEKSVSYISAILFLVLALQSGLTSLEPEKRFSRLLKNLCLLLTAIFHFIHNMVTPVLMNLTASQNYNRQKHLRALSICAFLVVASFSLMLYLWKSFSIGTWLFAVTAFCIEVIVKVFISITIDMIFLYDQFYKEGTWEGLDDAVYYVKAVGNSVEFCFAVFLFINGVWIFIFESGGTIRATLMLIHAYCNIWCEARDGWRTFIKRRSAVWKINSLPQASAQEIQNLDDVCPICHMEMKAAKVTMCNHLFHGSCLQKWLYVEDACPLCQRVLYKTESTEEVAPLPDERTQEAANHDVEHRREQARTETASSDEDEPIYYANDDYEDEEF